MSGLLAAIDPSTTCVGWAILRPDGARHSSGTIPRPTLRNIEDFAARWGPELDHVVLESQYSANRQVAMKLAEARGMWRYALGIYGPKVQTVLPSVWQHAMLSIGPRAKRDERKAASVAWAKARYGVDMGDDEADACAMVEWLRNKVT